MIYRKFFILLFLTVFTLITKAQFVVVPLEGNPVLEEYLKNNPKDMRSIQANDTLTIPFIDDFSKYSIYPDQSLWKDMDVFVNQSYGDNPPSIGVATFDALDAAGRIQSNASSSGFISDYLTSKPIDILNYSDTNPISIYTSLLYYYESSTGTYWASDSLIYIDNAVELNCYYDSTLYYAGMRVFYHLTEVTNLLYTYNSATGLYEHIDIILHYTNSVSDSLFLSFYYQPQGITLNAPESADSLVLEFKNLSGNWIHAWSVKGSALKPFTQVLVPIKDASFIYRGFQFRFYNYASIGENVVGQQSFIGNVDMWNMDYIRLDKNRNMFDTIPDDVAFVYNMYSCLKEYSSVPWNHYKVTPNFQAENLTFLYRNLSDTIKIAQLRNKIINKTTNTVILNRSLGSENMAPFADSLYNNAESEIFFPSNTDNGATFEVQLAVNSGSPISYRPYFWNDTIKFYQRFSNFYAYDDGTSEFGAGLAGNNSQNGKLAYKFYTLKPDTLRGVFMFFNRSANNSNMKYFYLAVWNSSNGKPSTLIYKKQGVLPDTSSNTLNQYHYYSLDTSIFITDTFFVGWIQTTQDLLNIGVDNNFDASSKVFYNIYGNWESMPVAGTLMIRPQLSTEPYVSIPTIKSETVIRVYPNPASDIINIEAPDHYSFKLYSITGTCMIDNPKGEKQMNVSELAPGLYFMKGTDGTHNFTGKIIINR